MNTVLVNVKFADKITLDVEANKYDGEMRKAFVTEISQSDVAILKKIFNGIALKDIPACPYGGVTLVFSSGEKTLTLYPVGDGCDVVVIKRLGETYSFNVGDTNYKTMKEMFTKYGVLWPHGL